MTCPVCYDSKWIYSSNYMSGGLVTCPMCQPQPKPYPEWYRPLGHSINSPLTQDPDGGDFQVKDQT